MVLVGGLAIKFHAVVHGHIVFALLLQHKVRVHVTHILGDAQGKVYRLPGAHGTKGLFEVGVVAVEQARQKESSFLKKAPAGETTGALIFLKALVGCVQRQASTGELFSQKGLFTCPWVR